MVALVVVGVSWSPKTRWLRSRRQSMSPLSACHPPAARDGLTGLAIAVFRLGLWWERQAIVRRYPILK